MSESVIAHTIKQGERWDTLAYHYYGDVGELGRLIDANPHLALCEVLPQGETVFVPVIAVKKTDQADLPPWLQED
ncbi:membrane protein [[Actinobacillus] muris]|uniref:Membrane protein n=1 Tax=Muribacter muris TaxID=67855 RepID=A0A0J5S175_9PAST|nr:tail protein X [Muribacter muris]KMK50617.1 membrane protein [[Actinobacillus] muris] [Muribacter muris]